MLVSWSNWISGPEWDALGERLKRYAQIGGTAVSEFVPIFIRVTPQCACCRKFLLRDSRAQCNGCSATVCRRDRGCQISHLRGCRK